MDIIDNPDLVDKFLARVIEIEENYAFVKKGQDTSRREELMKALDEVSK